MRLVTGSFAFSPGTLNVHGTIEFKILNRSSAGWSLPWASDCLASSGVVGDVACFQDGFQNTLTSLDLILSLTRFNSITSLNNLLKSSLDEKTSVWDFGCVTIKFPSTPLGFVAFQSFFFSEGQLSIVNPLYSSLRVAAPFPTRWNGSKAPFHFARGGYGFT